MRCSSEQIEFANVIIINKVDLLATDATPPPSLAPPSTPALLPRITATTDCDDSRDCDALRALEALVRRLNPTAKVLLACHGIVPLLEVSVCSALECLVVVVIRSRGNRRRTRTRSRRRSSRNSSGCTSLCL